MPSTSVTAIWNGRAQAREPAARTGAGLRRAARRRPGSICGAYATGRRSRWSAADRIARPAHSRACPPSAPSSSAAKPTTGVIEMRSPPTVGRAVAIDSVSRCSRRSTPAALRLRQQQREGAVLGEAGRLERVDGGRPARRRAGGPARPRRAVRSAAARWPPRAPTARRRARGRPLRPDALPLALELVEQRRGAGQTGAPVDPQALRRDRRPQALGLDAGDQHRQVEGLGEVVVGAEVEAGHDVVGLRAAGQEHQRQRTQAVVLAQLTHEREAVHVGHVHVGDDDVRDGLGQPVEGVRVRSRPS